MKKKILIPFTSLAVISSITAPLSLASCHASEPNYDKLVTRMKEQTVDEMFNISKYPRPTGYLDGIRSYLTNRALEHGYLVQRDIYGNIWFDIPATSKQYEKWPKVILQGHMDMVVAGLSADDITILPIDPVIETIDGQKVMHSRDYKTSLGADNGVALSIILSLLDLKNFNHGPLRVIFTADEETGMMGASKLNPTALDTDYLINIDSEAPNSLAKSCTGAVQGKYEGTVDEDAMEKVDPEKHIVFKVSATGFKGGHSGSDIKTHGNADRFLCELLYRISSPMPKTESCFLYYFGHPNAEGKEIVWGPTQLITDAVTTFVVDKGKEEIVMAAIEATKNEWKQRYKDTDDQFNVLVETLETKNITSAIRTETTQKIFKLTGAQQTWSDDPIESLDGLFFGYKPAKDDSEGVAEASANLGPLSISGREFSLKNYSRSTYNEWIDKFEANNSFQWEKQFTITGFSTPTKYYGWHSDENENKMIKLLKQAGQYFKQDISIDDINGGLELSWFNTRRPTINETAIGCRIDNVHNVKETLYIDSLDSPIKQILYALTHIKEIE